MFVILWEFQVKRGVLEEFERVYGAEGEWARLFRCDAAYRGTRLARDAAREGTYLTLDFWATRAAYEAFRARNAAEYEEMDRKCEGLTEQEAPLGCYEEIQAESGHTTH